MPSLYCDVCLSDTKAFDFCRLWDSFCLSTFSFLLEVVLHLKYKIFVIASVPVEVCHSSVAYVVKQYYVTDFII